MRGHYCYHCGAPMYAGLRKLHHLSVWRGFMCWWERLR